MLTWRTWRWTLWTGLNTVHFSCQSISPSCTTSFGSHWISVCSAERRQAPRFWSAFQAYPGQRLLLTVANGTALCLLTPRGSHHTVDRKAAHWQRHQSSLSADGSWDEYVMRWISERCVLVLWGLVVDGISQLHSLVTHTFSQQSTSNTLFSAVCCCNGRGTSCIKLLISVWGTTRHTDCGPVEMPPTR